MCKDENCWESDVQVYDGVEDTFARDSHERATRRRHRLGIQQMPTRPNGRRIVRQMDVSSHFFLCANYFEQSLRVEHTVSHTARCHATSLHGQPCTRNQQRFGSKWRRNGVRCATGRYRIAIRIRFVGVFEGHRRSYVLPIICVKYTYVL